MNRFLSVNQLAEILGVPVSWIYDRTRQGGPEQLPHYKIGKYVRFAEAEIEEYLKQRIQQAESI